MLREKIVEEVQRILHGPINGEKEQLEVNPLDFYSVGVLFPQVGKTSENADDSHNFDEGVITSGELDEYEHDETFTASAENGWERRITHNGRRAVVENAELETAAMARRRAAEEKDEGNVSGEFELTTKFRPSAAGISVLVRKNSNLSLSVKFGVYSKKQKEKTIVKGNEQKSISLKYYERHSIGDKFDSKEGKFDFAEYQFKENGPITSVVFGEKACLTLVTRPYPRNEELEIKTFTLINNNKVSTFAEQKKAEDCLFQPEIQVWSEEGFEAFEDLTDLNVLEKEDLNLKLLYRRYKIYALGHGISVTWDNNNDSVGRVYTQVLPRENVNGVDLNPDIFQNLNVLFIKRLSGKAIEKDYEWKDKDEKRGIEAELTQFVALYKKWIKDQEDYILGNPERLAKELLVQAEENLGHCKKLLARMQRGITILDRNPDALKAFEDANRAMFMQRVMADFSRHRRKEKRILNDTDTTDDLLPDYAAIPFDAGSGSLWKDGRLSVKYDSYDNTGTLARWRPFQLAFILSQVEGIVDSKSEDRDTVDLIWFPTGGGKTEAYLGLTAFTIFYRRLNAKRYSGNPDNGAGVTVLMRYTLRLLNKQQFERASILICSCDLIRRAEPQSYGGLRISNGIWMGRSMTPNKEKDQTEDYSHYIKQINAGRQPDSFKNSPPLLSCPCCGNRLVREKEGDRITGRWGYFQKLNNRNRGSGRYLIGCTNTKCDFHVTDQKLKYEVSKYSVRTLPVYEVDETIYQERPSLLFSTVDKFVQLAWNANAFSLFNIGFSDNEMARLFPSPELIIQDELHLISSALGTIYGVYEVVIDKMIRENDGRISKIVGATATVRNAAEQCRRLYGRTHFMQFPPPATDADDSFYARKIKTFDKKNRLYVGFMPSGVTTSTALIRLASVLLERIAAFPESNEDVDDYYTLIVYFNALKELGKFRTFLTDDIVAYRKLLANHFRTFVKPFNNSTLCELSSVMTADDITSGLDRLEKTTLPRGLDPKSELVRKCFQLGIRTLTDYKMARGPVWKELLQDQAFFTQAGLQFSTDNSVNKATLDSAIIALFKNQAEPIQVAPATNMISVGVDIPRLNAMIINGQPKTTAEYIQASSRVGREGPGVVFTFLAPTKNRDRSHYEQFKAFHQAYYYYVESTSVTPFSGPALEKVLPTVLLALTRSLYQNGVNSVFLPAKDDYQLFVDEICQEVIERGVSIYGEKYRDEASSVVSRVSNDYFARMQRMGGERRLAEYSDFLDRDPLTGRMVVAIQNPLAIYNAPAQFTDNILKDHIPTMQTLRNVESSSKVSIKSY